MNLGITAAQSIIKMFIMFAIGGIAAKAKVIDENGTKNLARLVNKVTNPLKIFTSYLIAYDAVKFRGLISAAELTALSIAICIAAAAVFIRKTGDSWQVERCVITLSNCGFMGIPLINALFGSEAVFYLTGFILVFNITAWTYGITLMSGKSRLKDLLKVLVSPTIVAIAAGLCFYLIQIPMPALIKDAITTVGDCTTPLAMMVSGATIVRTNFGKTLAKKSTWTTVFLRLIACPMVFAVVCMLIDVPDLVFQTIFVASACPCASVVVTQALTENRNPGHAAGLFAITTILCAGTLPLVIWLQSLLPSL